MNIREQITLYPELTGEKREAVETYVEAHPEWKPALDEAKQWDRLLRDVRMVGQDLSGDEALAYYVVTRGLQTENAPDAVTDMIRRVEEEIQQNPALAARVAKMEARLRAVEKASPAGDRFERLVRHPSGRKNEREGDGDDPSTTAWTEPAPAGERMLEEWSASAGSPRSESASFIWRAAAAIVALIVVYGVLFAAGHLMRPSHERLASFDGRELTLDGYENIRGGGSEAGSNASVRIYLDALDELRRAETSFIGLFPQFETERLDSASALLREVLRSEPDESFLAGEAAFLLGKTELALGHVDAAERAFTRVIASGGRQASEARRILVEMQP